MGRIVVAALTIGICAYLYAVAGDYPRAARRLPQILAICVIVLATAGLLRAVASIMVDRRRRADPPPLLIAPPPGDVLIGIGFVVLIAVYIWAIPRAGYLVATPIMLLLPLLALRPVGWAGILATVVAVTGVILVVFVWFLNLPIPLYPGA